MSRPKACLFLFLITVAGGISGYAQTTFATIIGDIKDPSGAVVPNVTITATNVETGVKSSAVSNESGNYTISQLREGTYTVSPRRKDFNRPFSRMSSSSRGISGVSMSIWKSVTSQVPSK